MRNTPTLKQIKTLQLIKQGYSTHRAMKEAGYSASSLKQSYKFKLSPIVQQTSMNWDTQVAKALQKRGIDPEKIADKFTQWLDAQKPFSSHTEPDKMIPDTENQIKAFKEIKEFFQPKENRGVKRKLTIEEFINEE